ncbi:ER membrane protein complex subunit 7 [Balamuthia mandrillaris]
MGDDAATAAGAGEGGGGEEGGRCFCFVADGALPSPKEKSSCCAEGEERGEIAESAAAYYEVHGRVVAATNTTRIILHGNGGQLSQLPTTKDGLFRIKDLPSGAYLLEVVSNEHLYPLLRVDVSAKHNGKVKARLAGDSAKSKSLSYPLNIEPLAPMQFFEERKGFNFLELFKNPMVIMMGVTLVMILVVPKLMDSEAMKEAQAQAQGQNPLANLEMLTNWGESNAAPSSSNANSTSESAKNRARRKKNQ